MANQKYEITKEWLTQKYVNEKITPKEIANMVGCTYSLVGYLIKKYELPKIPKYKRLEGKRFGRLIVIHLVEISTQGAMWLCKCDCGNERIIPTGKLLYGEIKSCGCYSIEQSKSHGMTNTRPYSIWQGMKTRCDNPKSINYHLYGGRGIIYTDKWSTFEGFWNDMEDGYSEELTLDRINNEKGYSKENCRWSNTETQNSNKRINSLLCFNGIIKNVNQWSKELGIDRRKLYYLKSKGLSDNEILSKIQR